MAQLSRRRSPLLFFLLFILALASLSAVTLLVAQPTFTVYDGDEATTISGNFETVGQVLRAAGISWRPEDLIVPAEVTAVNSDTAIQIVRARPVTVHTETGTRTFWTQQPTLGHFLAEATITVQPTDQVMADGRLVPFESLRYQPLPETVSIGRFNTVTLLAGDRRQVLHTSAHTVGEALHEAGLTVYAADRVEPDLGAWLVPDMVIELQRSVPLTIHADGRVIQTRSAQPHVPDVLAEAGIGLVGQDFTRPGPQAILRENDTIEVIRVTEDFLTDDEPIAYDSVWQANDALLLDERELVSAGQPGILRRRTRIRYENGVEVERSPDSEWVAVAPVSEVMGYGTRISARVVDTPDGALEYYRKVRMRVTAYTAASSGKAPDHPGYGITASGLPAGTGIVAVDPNVVPFRSWVYVPGYGRAFAGDTGGGIRGRWIDLGYDEDELKGWSGYVDVYYLTPVPENINYLIPSALP